MPIRKITFGFVMQIFDEKTGLCTEQEFVGNDQVELDDDNGNPMREEDLEVELEEFPMNMQQPGRRSRPESERSS